MKKICLIVFILFICLFIYSEHKLNVALLTINENRLKFQQKKIWEKLKPDIINELNNSFNITLINKKSEINIFEKCFNSIETINKNIFKVPPLNMEYISKDLQEMLPFYKYKKYDLIIVLEINSKKLDNYPFLLSTNSSFNSPDLEKEVFEKLKNYKLSDKEKKELKEQINEAKGRIEKSLKSRIYKKKLNLNTEENININRIFELKINCIDTILEYTLSKDYLFKDFDAPPIQYARTFNTDMVEEIKKTEGVFMTRFLRNISDTKLYKKDDSGENIFLKAVEYGKIDWIKILFEKGTYPDQIADNGMSALMIASKNGYTEIVKLLLQKGADAGLVSIENKTAIDYAKENGKIQIVNLLKDIKISKPKLPNKKIIGTWMGSYIIHTNVYSIELNIYEEADRLKGKGIVSTGLSKSEKDRALKGILYPSDKDYSYRFIAECDFDIYIRDYKIIIKNRTFKVLGNKNKDLWAAGGVHYGPGIVYDDPTVISLKGKINKNNRMIGVINYYKGFSLCCIEKKDEINNNIQLKIEKGKTVKIECIDFPQFHYNIYIPTRYDPSQVPLIIIFDNPNGNANPLQIKTAEKLNIISLGLVESGNDIGESYLCSYAVMHDLKKRFKNIENKIVFAGFSGGASRTEVRTFSYQDYCPGAICISGGWNIALSLGKSAFHIWGQKEISSDDFLKKFKKEYKEQFEFRIHPGGHEWYKPDLLDEAIKWIYQKSQMK